MLFSTFSDVVALRAGGVGEIGRAVTTHNSMGRVTSTMSFRAFATKTKP
jgi:hypothetical protein